MWQIVKLMYAIRLADFVLDQRLKIARIAMTTLKWTQMVTVSAKEDSILQVTRQPAYHATQVAGHAQTPGLTNATNATPMLRNSPTEHVRVRHISLDLLTIVRNVTLPVRTAVVLEPTSVMIATTRLSLWAVHVNV